MSDPPAATNYFLSLWEEHEREQQFPRSAPAPKLSSQQLTSAIQQSLAEFRGGREGEGYQLPAASSQFQHPADRLQSVQGTVQLGRPAAAQPQLHAFPIQVQPPAPQFVQPAAAQFVPPPADQNQPPVHQYHWHQAPPAGLQQCPRPPAFLGTSRPKSPVRDVGPGTSRSSDDAGPAAQEHWQDYNEESWNESWNAALPQWSDPDFLREETAVAKEMGIPWSMRGPAREHHSGLWRNQQYREGSERWANRGGQYSTCYRFFYSVKGQKGRVAAGEYADQQTGKGKGGVASQQTGKGKGGNGM